MDPFTQGVVGALCAQAGCRRKHMRPAAAVGLVAGMAPDLDVLIRSSSDSLLATEYHRHFTHALAFSPFGGLVVALLVWPILRWLGVTAGFARVYLWSLLGFVSHGLLDAMTSYGTRLFWPFDDERVAWNVVSVIDPLFTVPLFLLLAIGLWRQRRMLVRLSALWAGAYLAFGAIQQHRAERITAHYAERMDFDVQRVVAKPSFANLLVWRGLIDDGRQMTSVAIRIVPGTSPMLWPGGTVTRLDLALAPSGSRLHRDLERFEHFSDDWLFRHRVERGSGSSTESDWFVGDFRYAIDPASTRPLWGIRFDPGQPDIGVEFERLTGVPDQERSAFFGRLRGDWGD